MIHSRAKSQEMARTLASELGPGGCQGDPMWPGNTAVGLGKE